MPELVVCATIIGAWARFWDKLSTVGFGDLLRGLFQSGPVQRDYESMEDEELLALSGDRVQLTEDAERALASELERRKLRSRHIRTAPPAQAELRHNNPPAIEGDRVVVVPRKGVVLKTQANAGVLVVMPIWDDGEELVAERNEFSANVTDIVVLNDLEEGYLPVAYLADRLTIRDDHIHVADPDRHPDRPLPAVPSPFSVAGRALGTELEMGWLKLTRPPHPSVLLATWRDSDVVIAMGAAVPVELLAHHGVTHVLGGLKAPVTEEDQATLTDPNTYQNLSEVVILLDLESANDWPVLPLSELGVSVAAVGQRSVPESEELLVRARQAVDQGDQEAVTALLDELSEEEIEHLVDSLTLEGQQADAARILDMALGSEDWLDSGPLRFLRGVQHQLAEENEQAMSLFRDASQGPEPDARAMTHLGILYRVQGAFGEAIHWGRAAYQALGDPVTLESLLRSLTLDKRAEEVESALRAVEDELGPAVDQIRIGLELWMTSGAASVETPYLADKAQHVGRVHGAHGRSQEAIRMFHRCLEFQSSHVGALIGVAAALGAAGEYQDALAWYEDRFGENLPPVARVNRATTLIALKRKDEAADDLRHAVDAAPKWDIPYLHLFSVLSDLGRQEEAGKVLDCLERNIPSSEHLQDLRDRL